MNSRNIFVATATCALTAGLVLGAPFAASAIDTFTLDIPSPVIVDFVAPPVEPEPAPELPIAAPPAPPKPELPIADAPVEKKDLPIADAPDEEEPADLPIADAPDEEEPENPDDKQGPNQGNDPQGPDDKQGPNQGGDTPDNDGSDNVTADGLAYTGTEAVAGGIVAAVLAAGGIALLALTRRRRAAE